MIQLPDKVGEIWNSMDKILIINIVLSQSYSQIWQFLAVARIGQLA